MEKKNFLPFLVPLFSVVAVALSIFAVVLSFSAIGTAKGATLSCLSHMDSLLDPDTTTTNLQPNVPKDKTPPIESLPDTKKDNPTVFYTLRLMTDRDSKLPPCIGIYDAHGDLLQSTLILSYATLDERDLARLRDGIRAEDWATLEQLLLDYTE